MTPLAKPNRVERFPPGTSVQIHSGRHAGKAGVVLRAFTGRPAADDRLMIKPSEACSWPFLSIPVADVKVEA